MADQINEVITRIRQAYRLQRNRTTTIKIEQVVDEINGSPADRKQSLIDFFLDPERTDSEIREQVDLICNSPPFPTEP